MKLKDERTKMVNEVLNGIKVIKLYAWEIPMEEVITRLRNKEIMFIKKAAFLRSLSDMINTASPFLVMSNFDVTTHSKGGVVISNSRGGGCRPGKLVDPESWLFLNFFI
jgi:hypothetical protein